ncbi:MAG: aminoacyl-tRNA hydrolase [Caulobacteraceae bacterium]
MLILVGLGNPEPKYARNRHNVGFAAVQTIAHRWGFGPERSRFSGLAAEGQIPVPSGGGQVKALTLRPLTYYNDSGRAAAEAMRFYKAQPADVVAFYDEIDLAPGRFRMKRGGGAAGNNGVRSIAAHIGSDFRRARVGTGHPGHKDLVMGHVLSDFAKAELAWLRPLLEACAEALPLLAMGEDERYQAEVLRLAPAPKLDPRAAPKESGSLD